MTQTPLFCHHRFINSLRIAALAALFCSISVFATTTPGSSSAANSPDNKNAGDVFPGQSRVSVDELLKAIALQANEKSKSPAVRRDYQALLVKNRLRDSDVLYSDYVRIRIAFEATRAGGLWGAAWTITDEEPQSDLVWTQWQTRPSSSSNNRQMHTTAVAECDELSALFAFVARRIGLSKRSQVGLLWPTFNHTVAVWMISEPTATRIVVPTSQIFLDANQSLDTESFDPWKQKKIYDYSREDISLKSTMPVGLARYFVTQVKLYGGLSQSQLQNQRNLREQNQRKP